MYDVSTNWQLLRHPLSEFLLATFGGRRLSMNSFLGGEGGEKKLTLSFAGGGSPYAIIGRHRTWRLNICSKGSGSFFHFPPLVRFLSCSFFAPLLFPLFLLLGLRPLQPRATGRLPTGGPSMNQVTCPISPVQNGIVRRR